MAESKSSINSRKLKYIVLVESDDSNNKQKKTIIHKCLLCDKIRNGTQVSNLVTHMKLMHHSNLCREKKLFRKPFRIASDMC